MTASLNPYISQFGKEFDAGKSSQYRMAIQFALDGLSYALLDTATQTLIALECRQTDEKADSNSLFRTLERALESKGLNNRDFQSVNCLFGNRFSTLVPESLYDENNASKYLDFTFQIPEDYAIGSAKTANAKAVDVYAFPKTLLDNSLRQWKNVQFGHASASFINKVMESRRETEVCVNVRNHDFDMVIRKRGKLHFFNNFKFNTKEDFAYFLLFAMEQNGISGQDTPVVFTGFIRPDSDIIGLCNRYVKDLRIAEPPEPLRVSKTLKGVPFQYYDLLYQALILDNSRPKTIK